MASGEAELSSASVTSHSFLLLNPNSLHKRVTQEEVCAVSRVDTRNRCEDLNVD